jgi:hypothetical protein
MLIHLELVPQPTFKECLGDFFRAPNCFFFNFPVTLLAFAPMLSNYSFAGPGAYGITAIVVGAIGYLFIRWKVHFGFLFV